MSAELERIYPALAGDGYIVSSPQATSYNCIAWAVGESHHWWEPGIYWPVQPGDHLEPPVNLFESRGYSPCDDDGLEARYEKVALYADDLGEWTHAARQVSDGWWTSKLGQGEDILHRTPQALVGDAYGDVRAIMKRATIHVAEGADRD